MTKRVILASFLGALVLFVWISISWMYCPYHMKANLKFTNEAVVAKVLQDNAPVSGIYVLPNMSKDSTVTATTAPDVNTPAAKGAPKVKVTVTTPAVVVDPKSMPFVFTSIYKPGVDSMKMNIIVEFLTSLLAAFYFALLLLFVKSHNFACRIGFVIIFALTVAVISDAPYWNWWHFSNEFTYLAMADKLIGWTLAGTLMTMIIRNKKPVNPIVSP